MKRVLAIFLSLVILLGMLSGCQNTNSGNNTTEPIVNNEPKDLTANTTESGVFKFLIIGNSHSECSTRLLYEVFKREKPQQKLVLGILYYSGCQMSSHAEFIKNSSPEYIYYKTTNGTWRYTEQATVQTALQDEQWDVVAMQQMNHQIGIDAGYVAEDYMTVINHIYDNQEIDPKLVFHAPWANPDDESFWNDEWFKPWIEQHNTYYPDANGKYNNRLMYEAEMKMVQKYLVDTTSFLGKNYYEMVLPTATVVQYCKDVLNRPYSELYRDYTHLQDFTRLMTAYYWYARLTGLTSISEVNVDKIPPIGHQTGSEYPAGPKYEITQEMKDDIIKAVNWALEHPYEVPAK